MLEHAEYRESYIASAIKYLNSVIPAEVGIQIYSWMPPATGIPGQAYQVRRGEVGHLVARLIIKM